MGLFNSTVTSSYSSRNHHSNLNLLLSSVSVSVLLSLCIRQCAQGRVDRAVCAGQGAQDSVHSTGWTGQGAQGSAQRAVCTGQCAQGSVHRAGCVFKKHSLPGHGKKRIETGNGHLSISFHCEHRHHTGLLPGQSLCSAMQAAVKPCSQMTIPTTTSRLRLSVLRGLELLLTIVCQYHWGALRTTIS